MQKEYRDIVKAFRGFIRKAKANLDLSLLKDMQDDKK